MVQATKQSLADRHAGAMKLATHGTEVEFVPVASIRVDGGTQMRAGLSEETAIEYAEWLTNLSHIPNGLVQMKPVEVYYDGAEYWLADGFHRLAAWKRVESLPLFIHAKVYSGDRRAAILHAAGANADHGLRRTNADKRRSVETLLRDGEWGKMSDGEIAEKCKVDRKTVGNIRRELISTMEIPELTTRVGADGKTRDVSNIGRKVEPEQNDQEPQYAPYFQLLGAIRAWLTNLKLFDHDNPMLALSILRKGGGTSAYLHSLKEHLRFAEINYRDVELPRAIEELYQWESRQQEATEASTDDDPDEEEEPSAEELAAQAFVAAELAEEDKEREEREVARSTQPASAPALSKTEPRILSVAWPTGEFTLGINDFELQETDQGWRYRWRHYSGERIGPMVADRAACVESAKAVLALHQQGQEINASGQTLHDHTMSNLIYNPDRDINFKSAFEAATLEQLQEALTYIPADGQKVKRERIEARMRKLSKEMDKGRVRVDAECEAAGIHLVMQAEGYRVVIPAQARQGQSFSPVMEYDKAVAAAREAARARPQEPTPVAMVATCRVCGCTDDHACEGGCWWVEADLCSACAGGAEMPNDLAEAGFRLVSDGVGRWAWQTDSDGGFENQGNWLPIGDAIEEAQLEAEARREFEDRRAAQAIQEAAEPEAPPNKHVDRLARTHNFRALLLEMEAERDDYFADELKRLRDPLKQLINKLERRMR